MSRPGWRKIRRVLDARTPFGFKAAQAHSLRKMVGYALISFAAWVSGPPAARSESDPEPRSAPISGVPLARLRLRPRSDCQ